MSKTFSKKILVSPLNWGLGHASRCIPIIKALINNNFTPILASDGDALTLLQKEFPTLKSYELSGYNIKYSKGKNQKFQLLLSSPTIINATLKEQRTVQKIHKEENLSGIISDNRFGVRLSEIPSVYITHQINVLSGNTTTLTSKIHQQVIAKYDECWIPDTSDSQLSGRLSLTKNKKLNLKYIGAISRFERETISKKYDLLIILSGVEPQRSILEEILIAQLKGYTKKVLLVRGVFKNENIPQITENITITNYLLSHELEKVINESEVVLARSGFSTILDLAKLGKKAFFIPTPGQCEQEYLAERMSELNIAPFAKQDNFRIETLDKISDFEGFNLQGIEAVQPVNEGLFNIF
ncbi:glycosyltransferase [Aureibaculum sp. 2210JD6-5]|uniref:glycosyltransferase n=1 Tax=Aureibaculum sp. 2210JD6-5 TaxID=3103957 RepID=UPI002AAEE8D5|nr:glycosyltransferase [Aureibaculum sp. 2210JD6-5]MDY7396183.1 glycosyltransferase [Aureibaculum sp. 2210JD6-5]